MPVTRPAIYLDSNAGAPLHPKVREALLPFLSGDPHFLANPSSVHTHGRQAKQFLAKAREHIARSLGTSTDPGQIVFTSSGSEANQLAIRATLETKLLEGRCPHWITTPVEHDSVLQMVKWVEKHGGEVSYLPVDSDGAPIVEGAINKLLRPETALVSMLWVNNETGVISDVSAIAEAIKEKKNCLLHIDAAQAWGKIPIDLGSLGAHFLTISSHKVGGLAGTGAIWLSGDIPAKPLIFGQQEKGRRGGTENLLGAIAIGVASTVIDPIYFVDRIAPLRDQMEDLIYQRIQGSTVNGGDAKRVANTTNLSFDGLAGSGESLILALDLEGYSVSSGSACSSGVLAPSHVLMALGRSKSEAMAAIRISLSSSVTWNELKGFVDVLERVVGRLRNDK